MDGAFIEMTTMLTIDWKQCILNLRAHKPLTHMSLECGKSRQYLRDLLRRKRIDPPLTVALILLDMHLEHCGPEKHQRLIKT